MKTEVRVSEGRGRQLFDHLSPESQEYIWDLLDSIPGHEKTELLIDLLPEQEFKRLVDEVICDSKLTTEGRQ